MNSIIFKLFAVVFCFAAGEALRCYKCDIGVWNLCITTETTCAAEEHCFSGKGEAAGFVDVMMKGCLVTSKCNKTENVNFPANNNNSIYSMTKTCCDSNLCNSAPAGLPGALQLTLASTLAVFAANSLI